MPAWPENLPTTPLVEGFSETLADTVLRTSMDEGPAKLRQKTTAGVGEITCAYLLNASQVAALINFYEEILAGGTLSFNQDHPRSGAMMTCRFKKPPVFTTRNGNYFKSAVVLEILPT